MAAAAQPFREIPEKTLFRIGEVSRLTSTKTFVLRFWESEFAVLQPVKSPSGHRLYRREDIETVLEIKRLLYEEGFTIAGARKHLAEKQSAGAVAAEAGPGHRALPDSSAAPEPQLRPERANRLSRKLLEDLREELLAALTLLKHE
jgi:DNA-binding transcriptional MerR regulator